MGFFDWLGGGDLCFGDNLQTILGCVKGYLIVGPVEMRYILPIEAIIREPA